MKTKVMFHEQMIAKMLKNPVVKTEYERLNREEFAILKEIGSLASSRAVASARGFTHGYKARLSLGWKAHSLLVNILPA